MLTALLLDCIILNFTLFKVKKFNSIQEIEAGELPWIQVQPGLYSETLPQRKEEGKERRRESGKVRKKIFKVKKTILSN